MQNNHRNQRVSREALERKHESANPPVGRIVFVVSLVIVMTAGCLAIVAGMMGALSRPRPPTRNARELGIITTPSRAPLQRFPGPSLQIDPSEDLAALRAREENELNTCGWINRQAGVVRIPIERAMELILERGLPTRSTNRPAPTGKSPLELIRERSQEQ